MQPNNKYQYWFNKIKFPLIFVIGILLIHYTYILYNNIVDQNCYQKCSNYHFLGEASQLNQDDFVIESGDTIWVDKDCYNDWCICIDECNPGLCCKLLK